MLRSINHFLKQSKSLDESSSQYGGCSRTMQLSFKLFSCVIPAVCGLTFSWRRKVFFLLKSATRFSTQLLWTCCSCSAYKCAFSVSLRIKNFKCTDVFLNFLPWRSNLWSPLWRIILVNPLPFADATYYSSLVMIYIRNDFFG